MDQKQGEQAQGFEIFVKNVSFKAHENDIGDYFTTFGQVENVKILKDKTGRSKGGAFVKFTTEAAMTKALEQGNNAEICGRVVTIEKSVRKERAPYGERPEGERRPQENRRGDNRPQGERRPQVERPQVEVTDQTLTVFVGNLSFKTDEQSLRTFFQSCGKVLGAVVKKDYDGNSKGFGFVDFSCKEDVQAAILLNQSQLDGRQVRVNVAAPKPEEREPREPREPREHREPREPREHREERQERQQKPREENKQETVSEGWEIYVKNLSFKAHENDIGDHFSAFGEVESVKILKDQNGRSKGGAFVKFETEQGMNKALAEGSNSEICGRVVTIERSKGKQERGERPQYDNRQGDRRGNQGQDRNQGDRRGNQGDRRPQQENRQQGERPQRVEVEITETTLTIFVGNLSFKTNEDSLKNFFSSCGEVVGAKVKYDEDGNSKGFGHVDFTCKEDVVKAVAKNQSSLDGREIRVNVAAPRTGGSGRGGRGGRGGQGGPRRN